MILFKNAHVLAPDDRGLQDVLVLGSSVAHIAPKIDASLPIPLEIVDLGGAVLAPGFLDHHVHITGGGGEGGPQTSTPEIAVGDIVRAGVTSVFGCLGTDGITRSMARLHAKAKALDIEGVSTFLYTGAYQFPLPTLTGSVANDLLFVDKVVGVGEVAISDHRSSHPTKAALAEIAGQTRVAGMLSGKAGKVMLHLGDGKNGLRLLGEILDETELPPSQFLPTHLNRSRRLLAESHVYGKRGVVCDFTAGENAFDADDVTASEAVMLSLAAGVPLENLTLSSDAQGSLPVFNAKGELERIEVGRQTTLLDSLRALVLQRGLSLEKALTLVTSNVARAHKLAAKGRIAEGADADLVVLGPALEVVHVIARGQWAVRSGKTLHKGFFAS